MTGTSLVAVARTVAMDGQPGERSHPDAGGDPVTAKGATEDARHARIRKLAEEVAALVRGGNLPLTAAKVRGIAPGTYWRWMQRGREAAQAVDDEAEVPETERPFWEFWESVTRAEAESQVLAISDLRKHWGRSPHAVMAWLERRFPDDWSRTEKREHSRPEAGPIEHVALDARTRMDERLAKLGERLLGDAARTPHSGTTPLRSRMKQAAGRPQDLADISALTAGERDGRH